MAPVTRQGQQAQQEQPEPQTEADTADDELQAHALADLFPRLEATELTELAEDIRQHGLREPITLYEGKILDGRNRYLACLMSAVKPRTEEFHGDEDQAAAFVLSANLRRRHLTPKQRAALAVELEPVFARAAKARMVAGRPKRGQEPTVKTTVGSGKGEALAQAAKATGAGLSTAKKLKKAAKKNPKIIGLAKRDKLTARELAEAAGFEHKPRRGRPQRTRSDEAPPVDPRQQPLLHTTNDVTEAPAESPPEPVPEGFDVNAEAAKLDTAIVSLAKRWPSPALFVQHARAALDRYAEMFAAH